MIIGFLGKGGSGKSTLSFRFIKYLEEQNKKVLAIDADHNMDLSFNLGQTTPFTYVAEAFDNLHEHIGLEKGQSYSEAFFINPEPSFSLTPLDPFTSQFSIPISDNIRLMATGPHNDHILYGERCSHSLSTPLKVYLPFLNFKKDEYAIVDEKASSDSVGTGIPTGFSFAVVVSEPNPHGVKAAEQIATLLQFYGTPYAFVGNKIQSEEDIHFLKKTLLKEPVAFFQYHPSFTRPEHQTESQSVLSFKTLLNTIHTHLETHGDQRKSRSRQKFEKNKSFKLTKENNKYLT